MRVALFILMFFLSLNANDKLKIYLDAGGSVGDNYATIVSNGAKAAAKDLNVDLRIYYSDWAPNKMVENFKNALGAKPDGIVIMGHPGDELYKPLVKQALDMGIKVTSIDTELPKLHNEFSSSGFGYVGTSTYGNGLAMARESIKEYKLKAGDKVLVWGLLSQPTRGLRSKAILEVLKEAKINAQYIEISPEIDKDPSLGLNVFSAYMLKNPDTKVAIIDHGSLTGQMTQFLKSLKIDPTKLQVTGSALSKAALAGMKDGYIDLLSDGQPYIQGYLGVWQIVMSKTLAFSGLNIDTGGGFVRAKDLPIIEPLIKNAIR